jgi:hypothetical protein
MYEPVEQNSISHFGSNFWDGNSYKLKRDVFFYSELEYDHWILVECNPKILSFCEQPKKIDGFIDGEYKESIFDMWIKWEDGTEEFLEIKYSSEIENLDKRSDRVSKQIELQQKWCKDNNSQHRIVTEKHIRIQPLLSNSKIILPYIKKMKQTSEITKYKILKSLNNETPTTIKSLANQLSEIRSSELYQGIFSLYLSNQVKIDLESAPINQNTEMLLINE